MKIYEMMVAVQANITADQRRKLIEGTKSYIINELAGEVISESMWGKRALAYKIKKFSEAFYFVLNFSIDADKVSLLKRRMMLDEHVLRYIILKEENSKNNNKNNKNKTSIKGNSADQVTFKGDEEALINNN